MIIKVENLIKKFKEKIVVDHFNLELEKGSILGLIGPNGCGKTTSINCILSLLSFESGDIRVFGKNNIRNEYEIKKKIGIVPQELAFFSDLTVIENIDYFCGLYISNKNDRKKLVSEVVEFTGLENHLKFLPKNLSGGLKRRLNIACGIAHKPELIILDEPTVAVDAQSRKFILDGIKELNKNGASILYTTHYLDEAEYLCDKFSIMNNGKNVVSGDFNELINSVNTKEKIYISGIFDEKTKNILSNSKNLLEMEFKNDNILMNFSENNNLKNIVHLLDENSIIYDEITTKKPKLEDIFLELTGKDLKE